jgi:hypothetical protein
MAFAARDVEDLERAFEHARAGVHDAGVRLTDVGKHGRRRARGVVGAHAKTRVHGVLERHAHGADRLERLAVARDEQREEIAGPLELDAGRSFHG